MTTRTRSWPIWLFVAIALLLNVSIPPLINWMDFPGFLGDIWAFIGFAGVLVGEICFVVLVSGLAKRTWLGAYLFGLGLAVAGYSAVLGGFWLADEFDTDMIAGAALLPLFLLSATGPLFGFRRVFGWRLVFEDETVTPRQPLRLADIFSQIAIVASVLVLARVPQVIMENTISDHWLPVAITCVVLFGTSLVILPLHARVAFGELSVRRKVAWLAILSLLTVGICFGIAQCFISRDTLWRDRLEMLAFLLVFLLPAIGVFYLSLLLLAVSGLRLVRRSRRAAIEATESDKSQATHLQRLTWWRIGGAVAVTMATSIYLANLERWREARDNENATLRQHAQATGGELGIDDRIPTNLTLGPQATDDDLARFTICPQLEHLFLNGSQISDDGLAMLIHFPMLHTLKLYDVRISDDGLVHLKHLPKLETLRIENCDIHGTHVFDLPNKHGLSTLDLTQTHFGDDECERLAEFSELLDLTLNHTLVTDRSLASLGKLRKLDSLDLVGTKIEGEHFPVLPLLRYLDLSETNANDATVVSLAILRDLRILSLGETKVTNAALPMLARLPHLFRLDLNGNSIDDEGIRQLHQAPELVGIGLAYTQVTGSGFAAWRKKAYLQYVILDRTLVDDEGIGALIANKRIGELSLADTAVTDACLPHLAQIAVDFLDISGTQITFNGMISNGMPSVGTLHVAIGQFTPPQISQLQSQLGIGVTIVDP